MSRLGSIVKTTKGNGLLLQTSKETATTARSGANIETEWLILTKEGKYIAVKSSEILGTLQDVTTVLDKLDIPEPTIRLREVPNATLVKLLGEDTLYKGKVGIICHGHEYENADYPSSVTYIYCLGGETHTIYNRDYPCEVLVKLHKVVECACEYVNEIEIPF